MVHYDGPEHIVPCCEAQLAQAGVVAEDTLCGMAAKPIERNAGLDEGQMCAW